LVKPITNEVLSFSLAPWLPMCSMIIQYASQIPSSRQTQPVLQSQVESLLHKTYCRWKSKSPSLGQEAGPSVAQVPWDDIISLCINHKLRDWTPPRLPLTSGSWNLVLGNHVLVRLLWSTFSNKRFLFAWIPCFLSLELPSEASEL
jgi:hypothetical protein